MGFLGGLRSRDVLIFAPIRSSPKSGVPAWGEMKMVKGACGIQLGKGWCSVCVSALCACVWCVLGGGRGGGSVLSYFHTLIYTSS